MGLINAWRRSSTICSFFSLSLLFFLISSFYNFSIRHLIAFSILPTFSLWIIRCLPEPLFEHDRASTTRSEFVYSHSKNQKKNEKGNKNKEERKEGEKTPNRKEKKKIREDLFPPDGNATLPRGILCAHAWSNRTLSAPDERLCFPARAQRILRFYGESMPTMGQDVCLRLPLTDKRVTFFRHRRDVGLVRCFAIYRTITGKNKNRTPTGFRHIGEEWLAQASCTRFFLCRLLFRACSTACRDW